MISRIEKEEGNKGYIAWGDNDIDIDHYKKICQLWWLSFVNYGGFDRRNVHERRF